ncbi:MAG: hypothetical protein JO163_09910 [Methylobacteriaceae bacterium]|nr:hypothetical protein [Methylobacteriaceae bacterium]
MKTCPDGSVVPLGAMCKTAGPPLSRTKTCPDGSVVPIFAMCRLPEPPKPRVKTCPDGAVVPIGAVCTVERRIERLEPVFRPHLPNLVIGPTPSPGPRFFGGPILRGTFGGPILRGGFTAPGGPVLPPVRFRFR